MYGSPGAADQVGVVAADPDAERREVRRRAAAGVGEAAGDQRVLERPRGRDGRDRDRAVVAGDADARDRHDVADRAAVRRRVVRIVAVVPDELAPGTAGVTVPPPETGRPATGFVYWNDRRRRDGRDREGAVVAGFGDAGDRDDVARLEGVRVRACDRDRVADLHGAAARGRARHRVDGRGQRRDRRGGRVAGPEGHDLDLVAAAEVPQRHGLHLVDRRLGRVDVRRPSPAGSAARSTGRCAAAGRR